MYLDEYRSSFYFYDDESLEPLKVVNFQPVLRFSYPEYLSDGRRYLREILKDYPKYQEPLQEEITQEYYATEYADRMWQRDCEVFGEECRALIEVFNREFLAIPKIERKKKLARMTQLFSRYEKSWKYMFADFETMKEGYRYLLQWKD